MLTSSIVKTTDPTLVAPTGTIEKKPYFHLPIRATRSLTANKLWTKLTIAGDTLSKCPFNIYIYK